MNQREPTSAPFGAGQALPCLALLLLTLLAGVRGWSRPTLPPRTASHIQPYLVALGAPPLRFDELTPPPDLVTRPPAGAPPQPVEVADVANPLTNTTAAPAVPTADVMAPPVAASNVPVVPGPVVEPAAVDSEPAVAPTRTPPPIIPDELRPQARPEDFLPFFQIPSPAGDATVIVPVPRAPATAAPLPPSSATYTQTPR